MCMALNAKNKLSLPMYSKETIPCSNCLPLDRCSDLVFSWLLNSIDRQLQQSLIYCTKPSGVCIDLDNYFSKYNHPRLYCLQCDLANLKQNTMSVTTYYNTIKGIQDKITVLTDPNPCTCDVCKRTKETTNTEQLFQFFIGLNDSFSNIRR